MKNMKKLFMLMFAAFFCFTADMASVLSAEQSVSLIIPGCGA